MKTDELLAFLHEVLGVLGSITPLNAGQQEEINSLLLTTREHIEDVKRADLAAARQGIGR